MQNHPFKKRNINRGIAKLSSFEFEPLTLKFSEVPVGYSQQQELLKFLELITGAGN